MTALLRRWLPVLSVALLALAATITSLGHDFTYDDRGVIFENESVHALSNLPHLFLETYWPMKYGGDGYRPIVLSLFTLEWAAGRGAPWLFHAVNVLLAVATALAVFWCLSALLSRTGAWVAAALFAVHPVHVEVTGNVVGQSELIVALCLVLSVGLYVRRRQADDLRGRDMAAITALFAIGLFTKEHAIVLPGILAAAELTVLPRTSWRRTVGATRLLAGALIATALAYLYMRGVVQSDLTGFEKYPVFQFLNMRSIDRIGTMLNEFPRTAQLLVFPTHLSADYSPPDVIVANGPDLSQLPGAFICVAIVMLAVVLRRRAPVSSFGLWWLMIAFLPVSNLLIATGFITAERTLFFPSVGVVLIAGDIMARVRDDTGPHRYRWLATAITALLLVLGVSRSIRRQQVWKNNDVFFEAMLKDAPNGYRAHFMYARHIGLKGKVGRMELEYRRAIRLFPYDASMVVSIADAYTRAGLCQPAVMLFDWTYDVQPTRGDGRYQYVYCLAKLGRWKEARSQALLGMPLVLSRDVPRMRKAVHEADIALGKAKR